MPARLRLHDFLDYWAGRQPQAEFAVQGERRLTYRQAQRETNRLANAFGAAGLGPGDRLAVLARNCIEYPLLYLAASRAGVVPVPLNYRAAPPEWRFVVNDAGARMIIAGGPYLEQIDAIRQELEPVRHYLALGPSPAPSGWEALQRWAGPHSGAAPRHDVDPQSDLYQVYTSGTTGEPKGALLTQQAVVANLLQIGHTAHRAPRPGERSLVLGPMLHAGVVWTALAPLVLGGLPVHPGRVRPGGGGARPERGAHRLRRPGAGRAAGLPGRRAGRQVAPLPLAAPDPHRLRRGLGGDAHRGPGGLRLRRGAGLRADRGHGGADRHGARGLRE